jgi:hypothetical protein
MNKNISFRQALPEFIELHKCISTSETNNDFNFDISNQLYQMTEQNAIEKDRLMQ